MNLLKLFLKNSRSTLLASIGAGVLSGVTNAAILAVINSVLKRNRTSTLEFLWVFLGLCILAPASRYVSELLLNRLGQGALYNLRMHLSRHILAAPLRQLEQLGPGRLLATLTDDIAAITNVTLAVPLLCINFAVLIGCFGYMGAMSWRLLLVVMAFMAFGTVTYYLPLTKAHRLFRKVQEQGDALLGHSRTIIQGAKELKMHRKRGDAFLNDVLNSAADSFRRYNLAAMKTYTAASSWGQTLVFFVIGVMVFLIPLFGPTDTGTLMGYTITILYLMTPLQAIMNAVPAVARADIAVARLDELGFTLATHETAVPTGSSIHSVGCRSLELAGVTHTYRREDESSNFVLGPVDLTIRPGEIIFITGGNGSGKTTLIKILAGLYAPEGGQILVNGEPITAATREEYRQLFSVVFSDCYIFASLLGLESPDIDTKATAYLLKLRLSHKVQVEDGRLSNIDLSQGQRKRLALLTAFLEDRPIYIFDEWAADQDPYFKSLFYTQLVPELKAKGKAVIIISHDDRFYPCADRLIKLEDGQLVSEAVNCAEPAITSSIESLGLIESC